MKLINHKGKIYLQFYLKSKLTKRSLNLTYTPKNLAYATKTLLPIFTKLKTTKEHIQTKPSVLKHHSQSTPNSLFNLTTKAINSLPTTKLSTKINARSFTKRFFDFCQNKAIHTYTTKDFQDAIYRMKSANLSPRTIRTLFVYPRHAFKLAKAKNLVKNDPFLALKFPKILPKTHHIFTQKEINKLLLTATGELKSFLYIAFFTGLRSGEILALTKSDFDLDNNILFISKNQTRFELTTPKNAKSRQVLLPQKLKSYLVEIFRNFENQEFCKNSNQNSNDINFNSSFSQIPLFTKDYFCIYYEFQKLLKLLNLSKCGLHITRHTYTSLLIQQNTPQTLIAQTLGHSGLSQIHKTYAHHINSKNDLKLINKAFKFAL